MDVHDVVIRGGLVVDGTGSEPAPADVAVDGDRVALVRPAIPGRGSVELDARDQIVCPGFINILSHAEEALIEDGRSLSDLLQGVTLEVFGEGRSMGPLSPEMRQEAIDLQGDIRYPIKWSTLGQYLDWLVGRGISTNVASFIGASTVRRVVLGPADRPPSAEDFARMTSLVDEAMRDGAVGVASALIYTPGCFADIEELTILARASARHGGLYASHIRSQGNSFLEALAEFLAIVRGAPVRGEIFHLKAIGAQNWSKMDTAIERIELARVSGCAVTADMYPYAASSTGLDATMPPWVREGGLDAWIARLRQPGTRARVAREMRTPTTKWENQLLMAGGGNNVVLSGFKTEQLKSLSGRTLADVARERRRSVEETAMDLVIEDRSRVSCIFVTMSERNVERGLALPWVSIASDSPSVAPEGVFLRSHLHPRAYGTFARTLSWNREAGFAPLPKLIQRMTALPAAALGLRDRGLLVPGHIADVVILDPEGTRDNATFERPHQLAQGISTVLVNGIPVVRDGNHTNALPGRVVHGPGFTEG